MKFAIPEISWHNRDPVLSVDFQPKSEIGVPMRLASGGTDSHVLIWYISSKEDGSVKLEVAADLTRHQKAVNIVRWSPNGQLLGSGDDESIIFIWKQKIEEPPIANLEGEEQYKESWVIYKTLRGHMEDVMDISWSSNSLHLASGSVDNKLIVWDINRGKYSSIITDHKGFVQGVSWDPKGQMIASSSSDRVFRTFDIKTKKVISRSHKASLPFPSEHPFHGVKVRLYHDDTLQTYYRRLHFSPDGMLIAVPAGRVEPEQGKIDMKPINAVYIYTRFSLKVPVSILPCGEAALVTRWCPRFYALRPDGPPPAFPLKHRMIFAVGTKRSVLLYDTQQKTPIALITNIHYTRLTDLSWSPDGRSLVASSTDGFCSLITFSAAELGDVLPDEEPAAEEQMDVESEEPTPPAESKPEETEEKKTSRPSTPTAFNPSTPAATNPSTPSASRPSTPAASKPSTPKASKPSTPKASKPSTPKASKPSTPKASKPSTPKASKPSTPSSSKIDSYIQFKTPTDKSPKKQKVVTVKQKTPIKSDLHEDSAMPSWNDNSNSEIVKPTAAEEPEIMEIDDDCEDIRLVYEDTQSQSPQNAVPVVPNDSKQETQKDENATEAQASDEVKSTVPSASKPVSPARTNEENFLKQAKVTDMKEHVTVKTVASPKAPRRVNFVTLSSPKNSNKK